MFELHTRRPDFVSREGGRQRRERRGYEGLRPFVILRHLGCPQPASSSMGTTACPPNVFFLHGDDTSYRSVVRRIEPEAAPDGDNADRTRTASFGDMKRTYKQEYFFSGSCRGHYRAGAVRGARAVSGHDTTEPTRRRIDH
ncbi:hypothetical protein EVAR_61016_1 [Eumeta japonica]|uniref:Uncharacterized protein n=1 Tax=Eumeta variegata TaxID=151549 RepID=A0A4C1Z8R0_EUMVA|nr:hypothetical protein EVAR_61016_1 [Eumeta japonica]